MRAARLLCSLLGAALLGRAGATSNGGVQIFECDPMAAVWGCTQFDPPSPPNTNCVTENATTTRIMYWTQAPVRHKNYVLRSADGPSEAGDPTTYTPSEYMTIHLRVIQTGWKFRGLLLNAVDVNDTVVGEWSHPPEPGYPYRVNNPSCPGSLLHGNGDRKPYASHFTFKTPPAGTGRITFRALIKKGWANTG